MIELRIFFRKLFRLYVPECRFECQRGEYETYKFCGEFTKDKFYVCTRKTGHKGNHVACGTIEHEVKIWEA